MPRLLAVVLLALLAAPGAGRAATVQVVETCHRTGCDTSVDYVAAPGERNELRIAARSDSVIRVSDVVPVQTGPGCTAVDARTADCPRTGFKAALGDGDDRIHSETGGHVTLGPGNDRSDGMAIAEGDEGDDVLVAAATGVTLIGGPGDDRLTGSEAADALIGGTGADVLEARGGDDRLNGSDAAASVRELPAPDVLDGGGGLDVADYEYRQAPIGIDLAAGVAGEDRLIGVENVVGGLGDDRIAGDGGPNVLNGGRGRDVVHGGGGDDELRSTAVDEHPSVMEGGDGDDRLELRPGDRAMGGAGDDDLFTSGHAGRPRRLDCGAGRDRVHNALPRDVLSSSCERLRFRGPGVGGIEPEFPLPRRRPGIVELRIPCGYRAGCRTLIEARTTSGRLAGRRRVRHSRTRRIVLRVRSAQPLRMRLLIESAGRPWQRLDAGFRLGR